MPFYFIQFSPYMKCIFFQCFVRFLITRQCYERKGSCCEVCSTSNWKEAIGKQNKFGFNKHSRRNIRALNNDFLQHWRKRCFCKILLWRICGKFTFPLYLGYQKQSKQVTKWLGPQKFILAVKCALALKIMCSLTWSNLCSLSHSLRMFRK